MQCDQPSWLYVRRIEFTFDILNIVEAFDIGILQSSESHEVPFASYFYIMGNLNSQDFDDVHA